MIKSRQDDLELELRRSTTALIGKLCKRVRTFTKTHGEIRLGLEGIDLAIGCAWRLDSESEVICGSGNSQRKGGLVQHGLQLLAGHQIVSVKLTDPGKDLTLGFDNGCTLSLFCTRVNEVDILDNYMLLTPQRALIVGTCGVVRGGSTD